MKAREEDCFSRLVCPQDDDDNVIARFSLGLLMTQSSPGTSGLLDKTSPYAALTVDNWMHDGLDKGWPIALLTFVEARLTETAVSATPETTATQPSASPSTSTSPSTSDKTAAKRAASIALGAYGPFRLTRIPQGQREFFFLAPIAKAGFQAIDGGYVTQSAGAAGAEQRSALAAFVMGGVRVGCAHYLTGATRHRLELLSWVDVTWGRFGNYGERVGDGTKPMGRLVLAPRPPAPRHRRT